MKICVAASGGVDSLCALLLLKRAGFQVFALHGLFLPEAEVSPTLPRLASACRAIGVELRVIRLETAFAREVSGPFKAAWLSGATPNPCAWCNRLIKFGGLRKAALEMGAEALATGHYCQIERVGKRQLLAEARDASKDQSYFLSLLSPGQITSARFPLGGMEKIQCRRIVAEAGLEVPESRESQDICFAREGYQKLLRPDPNPGPIFLQTTSGLKKIGEHKGLWNHTIGQRRGLGAPAEEPLYVLEKDFATNSLIAGFQDQLPIDGARIRLVSLHLPFAQWPRRVYARLRHRAHLAEASALIKKGLLEVRFERREQPSAPGQIAAIYDNRGHVLAGGVIESQRRPAARTKEQ